MTGVVSDGDFCVLDKRGHYDDGHIVLVQVDGPTDQPDPRSSASSAAGREGGAALRRTAIPAHDLPGGGGPGHGRAGRRAAAGFFRSVQKIARPAGRRRAFIMHLYTFCSAVFLTCLQ